MSLGPDPDVRWWERSLLWMFWWCPAVPLLGYELWLWMVDDSVR